MNPRTMTKTLLMAAALLAVRLWRALRGKEA